VLFGIALRQLSVGLGDTDDFNIPVFCPPEYPMYVGMNQTGYAHPHRRLGGGLLCQHVKW
jgi:hypothetical protein